MNSTENAHEQTWHIVCTQQRWLRHVTGQRNVWYRQCFKQQRRKFRASWLSSKRTLLSYFYYVLTAKKWGNRALRSRPVSVQSVDWSVVKWVDDSARAMLVMTNIDTEYWSRSWSDTARPTALARRSRPGSLQASSDSSTVSERPRTTVAARALHPGLQCWHAAASAFRQPSYTCRTAFPAQYLGHGRRAFSVAGPMSWNSLPDFIQDPTSSTDCFRRLLKTYLLARN